MKKIIGKNSLVNFSAGHLYKTSGAPIENDTNSER